MKPAIMKLLKSHNLLKLETQKLLRSIALERESRKASEKEKALKAVSKPMYPEEARKEEAEDEEASESDHQQECILSGGVYLCHRLKDKYLPFLSDTLYHKQERRARSAFGRTGVQETVSLSRDVL